MATEPYFVDVGQGAPVVLLHGLMASGRVFDAVTEQASVASSDNDLDSRLRHARGHRLRFLHRRNQPVLRLSGFARWESTVHK